MADPDASAEWAEWFDIVVAVIATRWRAGAGRRSVASLAAQRPSRLEKNDFVQIEKNELSVIVCDRP
jgi:hypothetical protein